MKRILFLCMIALFAVSCSKKVKVNGVIKNGSPLERVEFIDASGVATLPLINMGVDAKGNFTGEFEAPKNGMYAMTYAGQMAFVYLKKGQTLNISGDAMSFPNIFTIQGDAKANNDFLKETQAYMEQYLGKLDMSIISKDEKSFLTQAKKISDDLTKNIDEAASKTKADSDVVTLKKDEVKTHILTFLSQYEANHGEAIQQPNFKVSTAFKDYTKSLEADGDKMIKNLPLYRNYLLNKIGNDFQKFALAQSDKNTASMSSIFAKYLKGKSEFTQDTKDYLLAFVISKFDLNPFADNTEAIIKVADDNIKNTEVKKDLKAAFDAVYGLKKGTDAPTSALLKTDGKTTTLADFKGKPTLVVTYASWNPYIAQSTIPVLKEVVEYYKSKMNVILVNLDDTKAQFDKTYPTLMKGISGVNVYADGGLNSKFAKDYSVFGFKIPGFTLVDKDGKIAGPTYYNLGEPKFIEMLSKLTGIAAPAAPEAQVAPDWNEQQAAPAPQPEAAQPQNK